VTTHDPIPEGVKLVRSPLGGYSVEWNERQIGWIHASIGNKWNAYGLGKPRDRGGRPLGRFTKDEAVRRIAEAAGWKPGGE
jgi:hypothetical protein